MNELAIRDAVLADLPALLALRDARGQHEAKLAEAAAGTARFLVATAGGTIVAFATIFLRHPEQGAAKSHLPKLSDCWVAAAHRSRGIGGALVAAREEIAHAAGCERLYVGIDPVGNARWFAFFRRRGYEPVQAEPYRKRELWPRPDGTTEEVMTWRQELVVDLRTKAD